MHVMGPWWTFDGDLAAPTFYPSINIYAQGRRCHYVISRGRISFCSDSTHSLRGQTVWMPELD
jgi:Family of unknown function (DUF6527)